MNRPDSGMRPHTPASSGERPPFDPLSDTPRPVRPPAFFPEDDVFARMIDRTPKRKPIARWAPVLLGSLAAVALGAAAVVFFRGAPDPQHTATDQPAPAQPAPADRCPAERVGERIQGNGVGGTDSGPAAIFAFQYAYYVQRSAELARAVVAPDAAVPTVAEIQRGIDSVPADTIHCVTISPGAGVDQYRVVITEYRPGQAPVSYNPQVVSVATSTDRTLITAIAADG
ncbi:hypothetical protein [Nocardia farcinica]|uniref:hypothetical protein n=1 Tax=Nocardia farcinica TaxID=37329 RepID=UPI0024559746|nr:hypothetical protein [Nocardia farcinica]